MKEWLERMKQKPAIAHLVRMQERFGARLGDQFAAAISYFSTLSLVPILMFAFAVVGMTFTVVRPDLLDQVKDAVTAQFPSGDSLGTKIAGVIDNALGNWRAIGIIGLLTAMWSGAGWVANLKSAVRAQVRDDIDEGENKRMIVLETLVNLGILVAMLGAIAVTFGLSSVATGLSTQVAQWLGLDQIPGGMLLVRAVPPLVSLIGSFLLFVFLFRVLPEEDPPWRDLIRAAIAGAIGMAILQFLTTLLIGVFAGNAAAALFGPVIILMLFFNLFAKLILMLAAWLGTTDAREAAAAERRAEAEAAELEAERVRSMAPGEPLYVKQAVAQKAAAAGLGMGYVTGAATGVGIGAIIAGVAARLARSRASE